jgi:hypothetical protein
MAFVEGSYEHVSGSFHKFRGTTDGTAGGLLVVLPAAGAQLGILPVGLLGPTVNAASLMQRLAFGGQKSAQLDEYPPSMTGVLRITV